MAKQTINVGTSANNGTGDPRRTAFIKTQANFDELYTSKQDVLAEGAFTDGDKSKLDALPGTPEVSDAANRLPYIAEVGTLIIPAADMPDNAFFNQGFIKPQEFIPT